MRPTVCALALLWATTACGPKEEAAVHLDNPTDWVAAVALHPEQFGTLTQAPRNTGWIAIANNDHKLAAVSFEGSDPTSIRSRARAQRLLGAVYQDLAMVEAVAIERLTARWATREDTPNYMSQILSVGKDCAIAASLGTDESTGEFAERAQLHRDAKSDLDSLLQAGSQPFYEVNSNGALLVAYDPCIAHTAAKVWADRHAKQVDAGSHPEGLEQTLFAPWLSLDDFDAYTPEPFGVQDTAGSTDDIQTAREHVRAIQAAVDSHRASLLAMANDDGASLLSDVRLLERFRSEWLTARARATMGAGRPRQAAVYAEAAFDISRREIGNHNGPSTVAVMAHAQLKQGRTRECLNALALLKEGWPEVSGLIEIIGDLAVLEGLDRTGDSKEN